MLRKYVYDLKRVVNYQLLGVNEYLSYEVLIVILERKIHVLRNKEIVVEFGEKIDEQKNLFEKEKG